MRTEALKTGPAAVFKDENGKCLTTERPRRIVDLGFAAVSFGFPLLSAYEAAGFAAGMPERNGIGGNGDIKAWLHGSNGCICNMNMLADPVG